MHKVGPLMYRVALAVAALVILHLATTSHAYPVVGLMSDKLNHIAAFISLAWLQDHAFPRQDRASKTLALLGYGLAIEIIQYFLPYRECSALDLLADTAGIAAYWCASLGVGSVRRLRAAV